MSSSVATLTPRRADLAVDVGPLVGVAAVERDRVERGAQPGRGLALGQHLEPPVGARRVALAGEHPRRVLVLALEREDAGGEREEARQVLAAPEAHQLAVVLVRAAARRAGCWLPDSDSRPGCSRVTARTESRRATARAASRGLVVEVGLRVSSASARQLARGLELRRRRSSSRWTPARLLDELLGPRVVAADRLGDLGEVADPVAGHDLPDPRGVPDVDPLEDALVEGEAAVGEQAAQVLVERGDAVVVERRGAGAEDRHVVGLLAERLAVADQLAADVAQRVLGAAALELVDRHDVGEVEHVDLLELRRGAVLRRHHVEAGVRRTARSPRRPGRCPASRRRRGRSRRP